MTRSNQQALALALQHHRAGRLADAEALCRQILAVQPDHAEALNCLGIIAAQAGRHGLAVELLRQASVLNPNSSAAHSNLGEALRMKGELDEAVAAFQRALLLHPDFPEGHNNLAIARAALGQLDEAIAHYHHALELRPDYPEACNNLGIALAQQGRLDEAIAYYRRALELRPGYPEACNNLGNALKDRGRFADALAAYRHALQLKPNYPQALGNLSLALRERGQFAEAESACRRALELKPDYAEAQHHLGAVLASRGQFAEAVAAYRRALDLKPDSPETHVNLGIALAEQHQLDEAIATYCRALALRPDSPEAHTHMGNALCELGRRDEALVAYHRAIELQPDLPEARNYLGCALKDQGQVAEAVVAFRRALQWKPGYREAHSNLVYALHFHPGEDGKRIAGEKQRWARQFANPLKRLVLPHANDRNPGRRLRIGYISPDFRDHVVGRNLLPLLRCHDREQFEVLCYSGVLRPDGLTEEIRRLAGLWRNTARVADEALAETVRQDGVDILVDLTQHMASDRLMVFARQPAPVQVSFAGYPAGTGLEAIGYRISDRYLESGSGEKDMGTTERVCLIDSFWCYDPCGIEVKVHAPPAQESGRVTFGSLNNLCKVNEPVLRLWARVLGKVRNSRLVLLSPEGSHRQGILEILARAGVDAPRVEFVKTLPRRAYLEMYHRLDIVLDPFPYGGHTTSLDALWMGVPVVSLAGEQAVSRAGFSQMSNLGLEEFVAFSEDDFIQIATKLAHDLPRLSELRATLRLRMEASPLMDAPRFARNIETAYRAIWRRWCAETPSFSP